MCVVVCGVVMGAWLAAAQRDDEVCMIVRGCLQRDDADECVIGCSVVRVLRLELAVANAVV